MAVPTDVDRRLLIERLRDATELLESIAADRTVLAGVSDEDRARLLQAVALVYHPDRVERRRMAKVTAKQRKAARVKETEGARFERRIFQSLFATKDQKEGMRAFVEKRPPKWKNE